MNTSDSGRVSYSSRPYENMVDYLSEKTDKKDVDTEPSIIIKDRTLAEGTRETSIEELLEAYNEHTDTFKTLRDMKKAKISESSVIQTVFERTNNNADPTQTNLFMRYYSALVIYPEINQASGPRHSHDTMATKSCFMGYGTQEPNLTQWNVDAGPIWRR